MVAVQPEVVGGDLMSEEVSAEMTVIEVEEVLTEVVTIQEEPKVQCHYLKCPLCKKDISSRNYPRHLSEMHGDKKNYQCPTCHYNTTRKDNMERHTTAVCPGQDSTG